MNFKKIIQHYFINQRQTIVTKINDIVKQFNENMKTQQGFQDNLNELDTYKSIGLSFTKINI